MSDLTAEIHGTRIFLAPLSIPTTPHLPPNVLRSKRTSAVACPSFDVTFAEDHYSVRIEVCGQVYKMMNDQPKKKAKDPLEGKTLESILTELFEHFGWEGLARQLSINCFEMDPSIRSSLKFLRKTPWARKKLENMYLSFVQGKIQ